MIAMAPGLPRARFNSSSLVRALAELTHLGDADVTGSRQTLGERLGLWLDWTDAISLSAALSSGPVAKPPEARVGAAPARAATEACTRVRADLARAIARDGVLNANPPPDGAADFSPYRRCYLAHQQAMEAALHPLRANMRAALTGLSPTLGRLVTLDGVMDQALAARERQVLATIPGLLQQHFERQLKSHAAQPAGWLARFGRDMQTVLLAELDLRWQPIEGMMEALSQKDTR
jgi:hypothetical protein